MLSHYRPPPVVFTFLACQEIAAEKHPLRMGRRWHRIGFIGDEAARRRAGKPRPLLAANYLESPHTRPVGRAGDSKTLESCTTRQISESARGERESRRPLRSGHTRRGNAPGGP